ncbi:SDR family NAD(P)-dependent oxidoreductase [Nocardiopsis sp. MG754419]|uniref:SDR family NAD(P)-dependent oxidoreductase n=1 Tax=Nocardiopsis sp. MG754419 TaxID=2259865 RepID=UPI001BAC54ED|nr:SDR family NAD(P)-dependent oxidoreductase [Nocardiopsis sp. MG754419]MBR8741282.1 3-oxoacyl-ACP reductase [Nocardiopsis sp. MG754419]
MELDLAGKRVLVTGASRGIGLATVRAFLAEGAEVTAVSRTSTPDLDATGAAFLPADLSTPDGPGRMIEAALADDPRLDVLVNNAGGGVVSDGVLADPFGGRDEDWEEALALNLFAAVRATRAALPALTRARGAVVTVGSDSTVKPHTVPLSYAAAKAALNAFSRGLAEHVGGSGVRINVVTPSATRTPLITGEDGMAAKMAAATGSERSAVVEGFARQGGLLTGRLIDPSEIARAIVLLASPEMPSAVGSNWAVHAGAVKSPA